MVFTEFTAYLPWECRRLAGVRLGCGFFAGIDNHMRDSEGTGLVLLTKKTTQEDGYLSAEPCEGSKNALAKPLSLC